MEDNIRTFLKKYSKDSSFSGFNLKAVELTNTEPSKLAAELSFVAWDLLLRKYRWVLNTFVFGNGFIGNDYFLLRYSAAQLTQYLQVIKNEQLQENECLTCKLETENLFYQFLNHLYAIREKLETFLCWNSRKKSLAQSILYTAAATRVHEIVSDFQVKLARLFDARNACVHNTYRLTYAGERNSFLISCFAFTLSTEHFRREEEKRKAFHLETPATIEHLRGVIQTVFNTLRSLLELLADMSNIDKNALCWKFVTRNNGKLNMEITF